MTPDDLSTALAALNVAETDARDQLARIDTAMANGDAVAAGRGIARYVGLAARVRDRHLAIARLLDLANHDLRLRLDRERQNG